MTRDDLEKIYHAALGVGHADRRDALLDGINASFKENLPEEKQPGPQLWRDLNQMNAAGRLTDDSKPLGVWLRNARLLAGPLRGADVFTEMHDLFEQRMALTPDVRTDPDAPSHAPVRRTTPPTVIRMLRRRMSLTRSQSWLVLIVVVAAIVGSAFARGQATTFKVVAITSLAFLLALGHVVERFSTRKVRREAPRVEVYFVWGLSSPELAVIVDDEVLESKAIERKDLLRPTYDLELPDRNVRVAIERGAVLTSCQIYHQEKPLEVERLARA